METPPYLRAILRTMRMAPGVWIIIIGMLKAPTSFISKVCFSWGAYCNAASNADDTPRKVAHDDTRSGSESFGVLARK